MHVELWRINPRKRGETGAGWRAGLLSSQTGRKTLFPRSSLLRARSLLLYLTNGTRLKVCVSVLSEIWRRAIVERPTPIGRFTVGRTCTLNCVGLELCEKIVQNYSTVAWLRWAYCTMLENKLSPGKVHWVVCEELVQCDTHVRTKFLNTYLAPFHYSFSKSIFTGIRYLKVRKI